MSKVLNNIITNQTAGSIGSRFELSDCFTFNFHSTSSLIGRGVFLFVGNRELITILPNLILSRLKQKLRIELFKTTKSACNELTVLSCDLNNLLKVVSGQGMPLIVNKSI